MKINILTHRFLEGLAVTIDSLNRESHKFNIHPTVVMLSAFIITGTVAFSHSIIFPIGILILSLLLIKMCDSPIRPWTKLLLFILFWTTLVSFPVLFITPGIAVKTGTLSHFTVSITYQGVTAMITFILRVTASAAIFTAFLSIFGWRKITSGLIGLRVPNEIILLLNLSIIHIPMLLRDASQMLSAREARIMTQFQYTKIWAVVATVVGDLFFRSYERAWRLAKAITARSFTSPEIRLHRHAQLGIKDILLSSLSLSILVIQLLGP